MTTLDFVISATDGTALGLTSAQVRASRPPNNRRWAAEGNAVHLTIQGRSDDEDQRSD